MVRAFLAVVGLAVMVVPLFAEPAAEDTAFANTLAVQQAMEQAKYAVNTGDHARAVATLEAQLSRINGNAEYLRLLRTAYRGYIKDLLAARQLAAAEKYRQRLLIIDASAASEPALRPALAEPKSAAAGKPSYVPVINQLPAPKDRAPKEGPPAAKENPLAQSPTPAHPPVTARAKVEDPFDPAHQQSAGDAGARRKRAQALLAQAEAEYGKRRFPQARLYFEQAYQTDPAALAERKQQWAYCKLAYVVDQLNQTTVDASLFPDLQREVHSAVTMAPTLDATAKGLLVKLDERAKRPAAAGQNTASDRTYSIRHDGPGAHGWSVTETTHFRIFHKQSTEYLEKVALAAERTRYEMYRKWFGNAGPEWDPKCEIYLHPTGQDYARATGVPPQSPGHSRIESDGASSGRVVGRRMDLRCDNATLLEAVLPHEATHVVLAGQFGPFQVPRWADEGIAVLSEPDKEIDKHRRNLLRCQQDGLLFPVKDLMTLQDYPQPRQIGAFYAQSVLLCEFLSKQRGPQTLVAFLREGLRDGYEPALRKHYGWDHGELQTHWDRYLAAELSRLSGQ